MDSSARYRLVIWVIIVLASMNLGSLGFLWYGHLHRPKPPQRDGGKVDPEEFFFREIGLDEKQAATVHVLRQQHFRQTDSLKQEIKHLNRQLTEELFAPSPDSIKVRTLSSMIGTKHAEFERDVFQHYETVKQLCRPEQQVRLRRLILEALDKPQKPPPRGADRDPQPQPRDEGHP